MVYTSENIADLSDKEGDINIQTSAKNDCLESGPI
jgi:hypothetical protein